LNQTLYKIGLRLARTNYVRQAIDDRANLAEFRKRPTFRILAGMFLIAFSFVMCWPAISTLGGVAIYFHRPWILLVGGPVLYFSSHGVFIAGMMLCGEKYTRIALRWATRCGVERLLECGRVSLSAERHPTDHKSYKTATDNPT
jgi:hypothetical protein